MSSSPEIDGYIEESFWGNLAPLKDFIQFDPYNGRPCSEETIVYLAYDEDNLYFAFNCLDSQPEKIKGDLTPRERFALNSNDDVRVILDTYYDKRNQQVFIVNSKGVQWDSPGDYVWESGAVVNEDGWSAEIKIPFKSIRFPASSSKPWGVNFARYIFRLKEKSYLTHVGLNDVKLEKSALLYGLKGIKGGKKIEMFPYSGYRDSVSGDEKDSKFAVGFDGRYSVTSNLNLDVTVSPDFSEVESDPFFYQLDPYEFYIREKRPFFQEAGQYLGRDLFYTRRVSNPKFAFKLTGKEKGYTIGLLGGLNKDDEDTQYLGVFRVKKDIFNLSSLTVTYSGYKTPDFTNHNGGLGLSLRFSKMTSLSLSSKFSYNSDKPKQNVGNYNLSFNYEPDEGFSFATSLRRVEKNYRPRAGYQQRRDFQYWRLNPGYSKRINEYGIKKINLHWGLYFSQDTSGQNIGYSFSPFELSITSMKDHRFRLAASIGRTRKQIYVDDSLQWTQNFYNNHELEVSTGYSGSRFFSYSISLGYGLEPVYNDEFTEAYDGQFLSMSARLGLKPTAFFNFSVNLKYTKQNIKATGEQLFEGILTTTNFRYQITKQVFVSSYIQHDSRYKRLNLDAVLGIELGMANVISFSIKRFYPLEGSPYEDKARSFAIKASYLIRI
ncbi:hypothetical protein GTO36_03865 [bacterium]|nr:hypothetical protein [bacterium]